MLLTGNQIGSLLLEHIISERSKTGTLPKNAVAVKSIVSTQLARAVAERNGVEMEDVLTGFRFISEKIDEYEKTGEKTFLFGFEESYGFLAGGFSRDKDAICSSMLAAEMCVCCAEKGMTLYDALRQVYADYGYYKESVASYTLEGKEGIEEIAESSLRTRLRNLPLKMSTANISSSPRQVRPSTRHRSSARKNSPTLTSPSVPPFRLQDACRIRWRSWSRSTRNPSASVSISTT